MQVTPIGVYNINWNRPQVHGPGKDWPFFAKRDLPIPDPDPNIEDATIIDMRRDGWFQVLIHRVDQTTLPEWEWITIHENMLVKVDVPDELLTPPENPAP